MGSLGIATMGKYSGVPTRNAVLSRSGGDSGVVLVDKRKPIIRVTKVKYGKRKRKNINIIIKEREIIL